MAKGRVLVIEDDDWVSRLLASCLRDDGYEVMTANEAADGFQKACLLEPDCIVCDVTLPDHDGYWVAKKVRTEPSRIATTPFVFLTGMDDEESRIQGFNVGADVYMTKPFRVDEVVAQIGALVEMANRLRKRRDSFIEAPKSAPGTDAPPESTAFSGNLSHMSLATVLTLLEMERRTGRVTVSSSGTKATIELSEGFATAASLGGTNVAPLAALREALKWKGGRFAFKAKLDEGAAPAVRKSIGALLLEAVRLEDEKLAGAPPAAPPARPARPSKPPPRATPPRPPPPPRPAAVKPPPPPAKKPG